MFGNSERPLEIVFGIEAEMRVVEISKVALGKSKIGDVFSSRIAQISLWAEENINRGDLTPLYLISKIFSRKNHHEIVHRQNVET